ncbi:ATP-binding protein [Sphingomonas jaspsi]|uniref:ATP-binding protein n=1 Tax=Sphingomonas jaspsi TaxID=392409 RepID=UPI0004BBA30F|nr:ATP-binding protein [Sphingomonas jaspsi]
MSRQTPFLAALLDALGEPALIIDHGTVDAANLAARSLLGDAIIGRDVRIAIRHPQALDFILAGREASIDLVGIGSADRPWQMKINNIGRRLLLVRLSDRSGIVASERMRTDFVANASHELRTPLATLIGYGETLAEPGPLDEALRVRFGETINREARRMQRIVDDLMSLSRIEAERYRMPSDRVEMDDIAKASIQHMAELADQKNATIGLDADGGPHVVIGDAGQLGQVVDNLIGNALRYGCNERSTRIDVQVTRLGQRVRVSVRDYGDGIAPEHLPRLTERFYRVDPGRSRDSGGTGLGLAIVKHIVERHRGLMSIRSKPGAGTAVQVDLPAAEPDAVTKP